MFGSMPCFAVYLEPDPMKVGDYLVESWVATKTELKLYPPKTGIEQVLVRFPFFHATAVARLPIHDSMKCIVL
jgi:hypothetical protein